MPERLFLARCFLLAGIILAAASLALWLALPVRPMFPPYLGTALLALGYGVYCRWARPSAPAAPPKP
jgi:hypothetical protein